MKIKKEKSGLTNGKSNLKSGQKKEHVLSKLNSRSKSQINFKPELGAKEKAADQSGFSSSTDFLVAPAQQPQNSEAISQTTVAREHLELYERVLDIPQRRHRAAVMRRMSNILSRRREIARTRMAPEKRIKYRAQKLARSIMRRRLAGARGMNYQKLSPADKMAVDRIIDSKAKIIARLARKLVPVVRRAEMERLKAARSGTRPKPLTGAGGLGLMPRPQLDRAESIDWDIANDVICENISLYLLEGDRERLNDLLRAGLADKSQLAQYQKALDNPEYAEKYSVLRKKIFSTLDKLIKTIMGNPAVYYKLKNDIQRNYQRDSVKEEIISEAKLSLKDRATVGDIGAKRKLAQQRAKRVEAKKPVVAAREAQRARQKETFAAVTKQAAKAAGVKAVSVPEPKKNEPSVDYVKEGPKWGSGSAVGRAAKAAEDRKRAALLPMVAHIYNATRYFGGDDHRPPHPGEFVPPKRPEHGAVAKFVGADEEANRAHDTKLRRARAYYDDAVNAHHSWDQNKQAAHRLVHDHINLTLKLASDNVSPEKKAKLAQIMSIYKAHIRQVNDTNPTPHHIALGNLYRELNDKGLLHHMVEEKLVDSRSAQTILSEATGPSPVVSKKVWDHPSNSWPKTTLRKTQEETAQKKSLK